MNKSQKEALVWLLGSVGLIVLLISIFTNFYSFNYGLLGAIIIWIIAGFVKRFYGIKERKK